MKTIKNYEKGRIKKSRRNLTNTFDFIYLFASCDCQVQSKNWEKEMLNFTSNMYRATPQLEW